MSDFPKHPPRPREIPFAHAHHGIPREDPWHWLRERDNPEVLAHLKDENTYTKSIMAAAGELPERLYNELLGRLEEDNESAPYQKGGFFYQSRILKGQSYRTYYRRALESQDWNPYFDANVESKGASFFDLGFLDVDPSDTVLAYTIDTDGDEQFILKFRNLVTGEDLPQQIPDVSPDGEWDRDGLFYYFLKEDETRRPYQIYRYELGTDPDTSVLVYEETDTLFYAGIYKSQDGQFLFASSESKETTELSFLSTKEAKGPFKRLFPRRQNIQYWIEHQSGCWLIRTNEGAPDFRLLELPCSETDPSKASVIEPARLGIRLTEVLPLKQHRILFETRAGLDYVRIQDLRDGSEHELEVPDAVFDLHSAINEEFETNSIQFTYSSPIRPSLTFQYNLDSRTRETLRVSRVPSGHNPDDYSVYRVHANSGDGTSIPVTVIHRKDLPRDGSRPAYLYGYGAYGSPVGTDFNTSWLTWLERGFTVAIAHVRGGGLLGEHWYQKGKLLHKQNSFDDFIACAEMLISEGYTTHKGLAIEGGSAGGLLIGAVLNQRPDLFQVAVASVPFVDVINTMMDPNLPLTTFEYEEWGNPEDKLYFEAMMGYSPYDNVSSHDYPALLVTAGFNDPRVPYWEAAKWVARLRKHHTGSSPVILKTQLDSGHMGASGRYDSLKEIAFEQAFILFSLSQI